MCMLSNFSSTLCNPMDYSPPDSSLHRILQAKILEWVPISSPGNLPNPEIEPRSPALQAGSLPSEPPGKPWWLMMFGIFSCNCWQFRYFLWGKKKCPFRSFVQFFFFGFNFVCVYCWVVYLDANPLPDMWLANSSPYAIGCFIILLIISFAVENFFVLCSSTCLFLLPLLFCLFVCLIKFSNSLLRPIGLGIYCLCFLLVLLWFQVLCSIFLSSLS